MCAITCLHVSKRATELLYIPKLFKQSFPFLAFCYKICLKDGQIKLETMQETVRPGQVAAKTRHQNESSLTEKGSNKNSLSMFLSNN